VSDHLDASLFTYGEGCNFWLRMRAGKRGVSVYKPKVNGEGGDYGSMACWELSAPATAETVGTPLGREGCWMDGMGDGDLARELALGNIIKIDSGYFCVQ
jgi:hypothetical protein